MPSLERHFEGRAASVRATYNAILGCEGDRSVHRGPEEDVKSSDEKNGVRRRRDAEGRNDADAEVGD